MSGVIYYKLSNDIYPGDFTKGCGLTGPEIDGNFYFLRGMDIESAEVDAEADAVVLTRLNGGKIIISGLSEYIKSIAECNVSLEGTYYDEKTGQLHLVVSSGETVVEKFFTLDDIHVDCTIIGDGSEESPFGVSPDILSGVTEEFSALIEKETTERKAADTSLLGKIDDEAQTRASETRALSSGVQKNSAAILDETERALDEERTLLQAIETEVNTREAAVLSEKNRATAAETALASQVNAVANDLSTETAERTEAIAALEQEIKSKDAAITKDIIISESSPLFPFISGIWENNVIPSGTTFTEFVEKLCSADTRMFYYVNTTEADVDNVISAFGNYAKPVENLDSVSFNASGNTGAHIIGFALPKPHTLSTVTVSGSGFEQNITDKFFNNPIREFKYNGNVYSLYYYKILLTIGLRSNENYSVTFA